MSEATPRRVSLAEAREARIHRPEVAAAYEQARLRYELAEAIRAHGHRAVTFVRDKKQVASALADVVEPGDLVIALGAGDINASARELLVILEGERST